MILMEAREIYLQVQREDIAYIQAIFESYEGVGIIRTVDRKKGIIVLLVVDDCLTTARSILASLKNEVPFIEISRPSDIGEDWLLQELTTEASCRTQNTNENLK
jgi:pyrimidine operon attenuation protein/uracil phosphoribosyltransferase